MGITNKNADTVVKSVMTLNKLSELVPMIDTVFQEKVAVILKEAKNRNFISEIIHKIDEIAEDKGSSSETQAVCAELKTKYSKELEIPRIIPPLRITIEDAIDKFVDQGNCINKVELKNVYDIYLKEYEKLKM